MTIRRLLVCALSLVIGVVNAKTVECSFDAGGREARFTTPLIPPDPQADPKKYLRTGELLARLTPQEREQMRQQMRQYWRGGELPPQREANRPRRQVESSDNTSSTSEENRPPEWQQHQGKSRGMGNRDSGRFDEVR